MNRFAALTVLVLAGGCSAVMTGAPVTDRVGNSVSTVIPNKSLAVSSSLVVPVEAAVLAAAIYFVVDPLSPNWTIEEVYLGERRYRIVMRKKRFATGGDGEPLQVFRRRAEQIALQNGASGYTVVEFGEGVESTLAAGQRLAWGIVEIR
jgi:hypothetical protein